MNRTLVKSPPELWSELSEVERLANHLGEFGEITISRLEPEHTVAWEGEHACGTVEIEASGWGTRVTLKAEVHEAETAEPPPSPEPRREPVALPEPPRPTVHQVIPDLEAWDRSAAEIESHALRQTAAAQRAAERAAERAERERKGRLVRWLFRGRRSQREASVESTAPPPEPPARALWSDHLQGPEPQAPEPGAEGPAPQAPAPWAPAPWASEPRMDAPEPPAREPAADPAAGAQALTEPEPVRPEAAAPAVDEERARAVLEAALDNLGAAHHRPFSRG